RDPSHRADALEVEAVPRAELELKPPETAVRGRLLGSAGHVVGIAEADRPRRRWAFPAKPEQPVDRQAGEPALEGGQGRREGRAGGELLARQAVENVVERERIVAERAGGFLEICERRFRRLVVPLDRRGLPEAALAVVSQLDLDDLGLVLRLPRDDERLREPQ